MAHKVIDRCKETTSTTGTGTLTLTGAVSGFVAMADAAAGLTADGDTSWFVAEAGSQWELFLGTRVDATHLARTTVLRSSNAGSPVNFTTAPVVFGTVPASQISAVGPSISAYRASSNQALTSATWTKAQLNAETFDSGNCFDSTTNYRWTPNIAGYYQVSFQGNMTGATLTNAEAALYKNGVAVAFGTFGGTTANSFLSVGNKLVYMNGTTDYLELFLYGTGTTVVANFGDSGTFLTAYLASLPGAPMLAPIVAPGPAFKADRATTDQTVTTGAWTKVQLNAETFDTGNCFDSTTNYRFQPNVEGYYQVSFSVDFGAASGMTNFIASVYKNGAANLYGTYALAGVATEAVATDSGLVYMNGSTDYIELFGLVTGTTTKVKFGPATYMTGFLAALPQVPQPTVGPAVRAKRVSTDQTLTTSTWTKVQLNATDFDTAGCFDSTTNYRWTPNVAGYYQISASADFSAASGLVGFISGIYKNGSFDFSGTYAPGVAGVAGTSTLSGLIYMNGTTDYIELWAYINGTTPKVKFGTTMFYGNFVRP